MARPCSVCSHPKCLEINRAIVDMAQGEGKSKRFRIIGQTYSLDHQALQRHASGHLTEGLKRAVAQHTALVEEVKDFDALASLKRLVSKGDMVLDSLDAEMRDPEDPTRYFVGPRAHELDVVYEEVSGDKTIRRRAKLSDLLERVAGLGVNVVKVESRVLDPRKLIFDGVAALRPVIEMLGKITGQIQEKQPQITQAVQVVLRLEPDQRPSGVVIEGDR